MPRIPKDHDICAVKKDGAYSIVQLRRGDFRPLETASSRADAESRAKALAAEHKANAWVEEGSGIFRSLQD